MGYSEQMLEVFPHSWRFDNGYMHPGDRPGLASSLTKNWRRNTPMTLPVCRLLGWKMARCGTGNRGEDMKSVVIQQPNQLVIEERALPEPATGEVRQSATGGDLWLRQPHLSRA
jgi:hypothetical protein